MVQGLCCDWMPHRPCDAGANVLMDAWQSPLTALHCLQHPTALLSSTYHAAAPWCSLLECTIVSWLQLMACCSAFDFCTERDFVAAEPRERDRIDGDSADRGERGDRQQRAAAADQPHTGIIKMRGLPFAATADDIVQWFSRSVPALT